MNPKELERQARLAALNEFGPPGPEMSQADPNTFGMFRQQPPLGMQSEQPQEPGIHPTQGLEDLLLNLSPTKALMAGRSAIPQASELTATAPLVAGGMVGGAAAGAMGIDKINHDRAALEQLSNSQPADPNSAVADFIRKQLNQKPQYQAPFRTATPRIKN